MKPAVVLSLFLIGAILVLSLILFLLGNSNRIKLNHCRNNESANCFSTTCPSIDGSPNTPITATCQSYSYRCVDANHVMCSFATGVVVPIDPADKGIIVCSGSNLPCT